MGKFLLSLVLVLLLVNLAHAQTTSETVTITTYYPAPYGEYRQIKLTPTPSLGTACSNPGTVYYNSSKNRIYYCDGSTSTWIALARQGQYPVQYKNCTYISRGGGGDWTWTNCPAGKVMRGFTARVYDDDLGGGGVFCCDAYINVQ